MADFILILYDDIIGIINGDLEGKMLKEFKKFIVRGNVIDLAVGIVIGSAFTGIVNSLVNDVIMPFIGVITAGINFKNIRINLTPLANFLDNDVSPWGGVYMPIGLFINAIVEFLIIAMTLFIVIKAINIYRDRVDNKSGEEKLLKTEEVKLMKEIRDILKNQSRNGK